MLRIQVHQPRRPPSSFLDDLQLGPADAAIVRRLQPLARRAQVSVFEICFVAEYSVESTGFGFRLHAEAWADICYQRLEDRRMPAEVRLEIVEGEMRGSTFVFEEHDTFVFGREADCHVHLPKDPTVSRHHFIMEVNPPDARVRDLGSLNGTYVNAVKYGGREQDETLEDVAGRQYPEVDVGDADTITVGETVFALHIRAPALCWECGTEIEAGESERCEWRDAAYLCDQCRPKVTDLDLQPGRPPRMQCQRCGKDVSGEVRARQPGAIVCEECHDGLMLAPAAFFASLFGDGLGAGEELGERITGYEIEDVIAASTEAAVCRARRKADGEAVAVKVMLSRVPVRSQAREKFFRDIELLQRLQHENLVKLFDFGGAGSVFFFIMEYCNGGDAEQLVACRGGRLPVPEASAVMLDVLDGLGCAHAEGLVHRNIKPRNILLAGAAGRRSVKIGDLGVNAKFQTFGFGGLSITGRSVGEARTRGPAGVESGLAQPPVERTIGNIATAGAGAPLPGHAALAFAPREQVANFRFVSPASDVWSAGALFRFMLTGQPPYRFTEDRDPMEVVLSADTIPIRELDPDVPDRVVRVMARAMAVRVSDRYQNAAEMRRALEDAL